MKRIVKRLTDFLREIMNDPKERHAFIVGLLEPFFLWMKCPTGYLQEIEKEYHYYCLGKYIQMIIIGTFALVIAALFIRGL